MSEENVETIRWGLRAFHQRDKDAWIAICDPEVENLPPREWPESEPLSGAEAIWGFFVEAQEMWEEGSFEWGEMIDAGSDRVVANQRTKFAGQDERRSRRLELLGRIHLPKREGAPLRVVRGPGRSPRSRQLKEVVLCTATSTGRCTTLTSSILPSDPSAVELRP